MEKCFISWREITEEKFATDEILRRLCENLELQALSDDGIPIYHSFNGNPFYLNDERIKIFTENRYIENQPHNMDFILKSYQDDKTSILKSFKYYFRVSELDLYAHILPIYCCALFQHKLKNLNDDNFYIFPFDTFEAEKFGIKRDIYDKTVKNFIFLKSDIQLLQDKYNNFATLYETKEGAYQLKNTPQPNAKRWEDSCRAAIKAYVAFLDKRPAPLTRDNFSEILKTYLPDDVQILSKVESIAWKELPESLKQGTGRPSPKK